ncbi:uncharacterized protein ZBAI_06733 [Zygosaccharomyces bailii ISA1307]|uniref:BN860_03642g1_1 n=1 Tax=Zygosaccharomyces bailii (strain CLIB 213 / ATCC 58445 / CBS 680 / BCRC 21525 / NBRC 1098 / NCYC 1416 / NRRL Y-2227) TaxID=1333698 RepID=A0A8J2T3G6_ZYGB2|nr:BN860_03642g1_1 [Zygosaccharomyces bailii CLIB 213]CDH14947.1 uncharacterized protein ZBAI_06733 [Zygosaccharomyces bailii ISA1307]
MININDKVLVNGHYGLVKFVGNTEFADGIWYGIELDDCLGRNDGSVNGKQYFEMKKKGQYGIFCRLSSLELVDEKVIQGDSIEVSGVLEEKARLLHENDQLRQQIETIKLEGPYDIIEFLTIQNTDLSKRVEYLEKEITEMKHREETHVKLQAVYVEMERELREELEEMELSYHNRLKGLEDKNDELVNSLANKGNSEAELVDLKSKVKLMEQDVYESKFLKGLHDLHTKEETRKPQFEFQYLSERILDDHIRNSFLQKHKCRFLLLALGEISKMVEGKALDEVFQGTAGDIFAWISLFLGGSIPNDRIKLDPILDFLDAYSEIDQSCLLALNCFKPVFGSIVPALFAYQLERGSAELNLKAVSSVYSRCLSIQKRAQELIEMSDNSNLQLNAHGWSTQKLFLILFDDILGEFESVPNVPRILDVIEDISSELEGVELQQCEKNLAQIPPEEIHGTIHETTLYSLPSETAHLESSLHNKESQINELTVKVKILQQRITTLETQENSLDVLNFELDASEKKYHNLLRDNSNLEKIVGDLKGKLLSEKLKSYQLCPNENYNHLASELITADKLDLVSQIRDLRQAVARNVKKESNVVENMNWLKKAVPLKSNDYFDVSFSNKIHSLATDVFEFINNSTSYSLKEKCFRKSYLTNAIFKKNAIESLIRNVIEEIPIDQNRVPDAYSL